MGYPLSFNGLVLVDRKSLHAIRVRPWGGRERGGNRERGGLAQPSRIMVGRDLRAVCLLLAGALGSLPVGDLGQGP
jgi:hypothetical protein